MVAHDLVRVELSVAWICDSTVGGRSFQNDRRRQLRLARNAAGLVTGRDGLA